MKRIQTGDD